MKNCQCESQKSLITIHKWLLESGDGPSTSICIPYSALHHNNPLQQKTHLNRTIKRKRLINQDRYQNTLSFVHWLYDLIKKVFVIYDNKHSRVDTDISRQSVGDTTLSTLTCSTFQLENVDSCMNSLESKLLSSVPNRNVIKTEITSIPNQTSLQPTALHLSKSTQTATFHQSDMCPFYPLYCFTIKDGQILPLTISSLLLLNIFPMHQQETSTFTIHTNSDRTKLPLNECHQPSYNREYLPKMHRCSSTNTHAPEVSFAENTNQLIKQAWVSSRFGINQ